jgi:hypothetical protein
MRMGMHTVVNRYCHLLQILSLIDWAEWQFDVYDVGDTDHPVLFKPLKRALKALAKVESLPE